MKSKYKRLEAIFLKEEYRREKQNTMHPIPSTKIQFRDIKDHADLMDAYVKLIVSVCKLEMYGWPHFERSWCHLEEEITYLKSEIAHFLRIQSAAQGIAVESTHDVFEHGSEKGARLNAQ